MVSHNSPHTLDNIMTIQTDSQKPEMTYSKSRSLVALVTGTMMMTMMMRTMTSTFEPELLLTLLFLPCVFQPS